MGDEIADIVGGGTPSTSIEEYWDGDIDWYSPTEIGKSAYVGKSNKQITLLGLEKSSAKVLPPYKTILFTSRAGIGDMAILTKEAATNQGFQSLVVNEEYDPYFIYSLGFKIKRYALKMASGSTFLEISAKGLSKMKIACPSYEEQSCIGSFFSELDQLITLHQRKPVLVYHLANQKLRKTR
ncbi:type I restriction enzyme, S subunit [Granulicatella balaenopterae]|uniref:Type I restriction enzyme, S subunit n=1 Tax=Granulicatella balaenopterae TaxID=137733 RepID=A0A1H9NIK7_9LACT|nr:type I restriction enzyme, S subunit [Granulicatella balaenopterae]